VQTWQTDSTSPEATLKIASQVGSRLKGGEVIELVSDLGGGKTTFVKGMVEGMGSPDHVHSPSFTLSNEYKAGSTTLYHFDFYRLEEPGIMREELAESLSDPNAVVVVEWPEIVEDVLPPNYLSIHFQVTGEKSRSVIFNYPENFKYLTPN
jgi:tRNA threonylcarbamoyladenosine biosynthesis protein TsaE